MSASKGRLTEENVKKVTGQFELESVFTLTMNRMGLRLIENLGGCPNLTSVDLSHNRIERIEGLDALKQLKRLDLRDNEISVLENVESLESLETLMLQGNRISSLDDVACLTKLPLRTLIFQTVCDGVVDHDESNPVCSHPSYRTAVRRMLPQLKSLDDEWFDLVDAAGDGDLADGALAVPDVKVSTWFSAEEVRASLDADPPPIKGMDEFELALTDCKRIGARAQELLDDFRELKLT